MGEALITRRGGGTDLNFKIIAVAAESDLPANAKENTFAVITENAIGNTFFQVSQPTTAVNGDIWFETGFTKTAREFNAIKKGSLQIYPRRTYQYNGTEWINKAARIYQNGEWKSVSFFIYNYGDVENVSLPWTFGRAANRNGSGTKRGNYVEVTVGSDGGWSAGPTNALDFTNYKTLRFYTVSSIAARNLTRYTISGGAGTQIYSDVINVDISAISGTRIFDIIQYTTGAYPNAVLKIYSIELI